MMSYINLYQYLRVCKPFAFFGTYFFNICFHVNVTKEVCNFTFKTFFTTGRLKNVIFKACVKWSGTARNTCNTLIYVSDVIGASEMTSDVDITCVDKYKRINTNLYKKYLGECPFIINMIKFTNHFILVFFKRHFVNTHHYTCL